LQRIFPTSFINGTSYHGYAFQIYGKNMVLCVPKSLLKNIVELVSKGKKFEHDHSQGAELILHQNSGKILEQSSKNAVSLKMMSLI
jgi:hypothetical protein